MSTNYNKFFNNNVKEDEQKINTVESEETTKVVEPEEDLEDTTVGEPEGYPEVTEGETTVPEEQTTPIPVYGINNCTKLNVRTEPNKDGDVVCVLDSTSTFEIEELESDSEWVKVFLNNGVEGFCMKMYVAIK